MVLYLAPGLLSAGAFEHGGRPWWCRRGCAPRLCSQGVALHFVALSLLLVGCLLLGGGGEVVILDPHPMQLAMPTIASSMLCWCTLLPEGLWSQTLSPKFVRKSVVAQEKVRLHNVAVMFGTGHLLSVVLFLVLPCGKSMCVCCPSTCALLWHDKFQYSLLQHFLAQGLDM